VSLQLSFFLRVGGHIHEDWLTVNSTVEPNLLFGSVCIPRAALLDCKTGSRAL
jgi:hypothetical protein